MEIDGYSDFKPIGSGGFSQVYEAWQASFNRRVAVKVLTVGVESERDRQVFENECRTMGAVSEHPHMVSVYDAGFTNDQLPYIAMELYRGTLLDRLRTEGPLSLDETLDIGVKLCGALQRARDEQILHRDIKPQNVFVSSYGIPALGDFGIAFSLQASDRANSGGGVTLHYAAPELLDGEPPTESADLYSLGATLYTVLAGRRPFARPGERLTQAETMNRVLSEPAPPIVEQSLPGFAERAIRGLLAKHPHDRPRSANDMGLLLRSLQEQLGVPATPLVIADTAMAEEQTIGRDDLAPLDSAVSVAPIESTSATIVRPDVKPLDQSDSSDRASIDLRRRLIATAGLTVIGLAVAVGIVLSRSSASGDDRAGSETSSIEVGAPQTPRITPLRSPADIGATRSGGRTVFSWEPVEGAVSYLIKRVDDGSDGGRSLESTSPEIEIESTDSVCITVAAVSESGRQSQTSSVACAP